MLTTWGNSTGNPSPSLELNFVGQSIAGALDPRITFSRASTATRVNSAGLIETVATNAPRFDYDPVTKQPKGLLIEEQRTNLLTYSQEFNDAAWDKVNTTITANAVVAPDGTVTADRLIEAATSTSHILGFRSTIAVISAPYVFSVYLKKGSGATAPDWVQLYTGSGFIGCANFNLTTGLTGSTNFSSSSITNVGDGWYRCLVSFTPPATNVQFVIAFSNNTDTLTRGPSYMGNATSDVYIWGAQLEAGSFPTSYIPTVASQVTRSADSASMTGANFSSWYNQSEGTLFAEADSAGGVTPPCFTSIDDTTTSNRIQIRRATSNTLASFKMVSSGGSIDVTLANGSAFGFNKQAAAFKASDQNAVSNGVLFTGITSITPMPTVTQMVLGNGAGSAYLNGHIKRLAYYPRRLSNSELQGITS